jgi:hypothetical protein
MVVVLIAQSVIDKEFQMPMIPYASKKPLKLAKEPNARDNIKHPITERRPETSIKPGNSPCRRYANGKLDIEYVAQNVVDIIHKAEYGGKLNSLELAMLATIIPGKYYHTIDPLTAKTLFKITKEEKALVALHVFLHFQAEKNWNAGRGSGNLSPYKVTKV